MIENFCKKILKSRKLRGSKAKFFQLKERPREGHVTPPSLLLLQAIFFSFFSRDFSFLSWLHLCFLPAHNHHSSWARLLLPLLHDQAEAAAAAAPNRSRSSSGGQLTVSSTDPIFRRVLGRNPVALCSLILGEYKSQGESTKFLWIQLQFSWFSFSVLELNS